MEVEEMEEELEAKRLRVCRSLCNRVQTRRQKIQNLDRRRHNRHLLGSCNNRRTRPTQYCMAMVAVVAAAIGTHHTSRDRRILHPCHMWSPRNMVRAPCNWRVID